MIPTVLKPGRQGAPGVRFRRIVEYVGRDDQEAKSKGQSPLTAESCGVFNMQADCATSQDRAQLWQIMSADAAQASYKGSPVYYFDVSWMEGEHPTRPQLEDAAQHFLDGLGFGKCPAFWAVHRDTEHDHLHVVVNKVTVLEDGSCVVAQKPRFDYRILARLAREVEIAQGWQHAPGYYVAVERNGRKKIMPMQEAAARGLWNEDWEKQKLSRNAIRAEHNLGGGDSFQAWVTQEPAQALYKVLQQSGASWARVHETLAFYGVGIEPKGSGMVVTATLDDGRVLAAKASQLGKWAGKSALEKRLGTYQLPEKDVEAAKKKAQKSYQQTVRAQRAGEKVPQKDSQKDARDPKKKAEHAAARQKLAERFEREQSVHNKEVRQQQRTALRARHQQERKSVRANLARQRRKLFQAAKAGHRRVTQLELALHARERAMRLEELQQRQREERNAGWKSAPPRAVTWRVWLQQQAEQGDAAAQAALRGIRYQEQRKKKFQANAIESANAALEEEEQIKALTVARLRAQVDRRLQWVFYKSGDGKLRMVDQGWRIVVKELDEDTLEAALRVAGAKYGNQVSITGSAEFRERAARMAVRLGIGVQDGDLQKVILDECETIGSKFEKSPPSERKRPDARRGVER